VEGVSWHSRDRGGANVHLPCVIAEVDEGQGSEPGGSNRHKCTIRLVAIQETGRHDPVESEVSGRRIGYAEKAHLMT